MIILRKFKIYFLKKIMFGYRKLKRDNNLELFYFLNDDLTNFNFKFKNKSIFFFGNNIYNLELCIRQYLLKEIAGYRLQKFILFFYSDDKYLCYPLPKEWIKILKSHNIKVNTIVCNILWIFYLLYKMLVSIKLLFGIFYYNLSNQNTKKNNIKFSYFFNLSESNIPKQNKNYKT